jgi:hypothetical protein
MAFSVKNETFLWREEVFPVLEQKIKPDKTIWFHAALLWANTSKVYRY